MTTKTTKSSWRGPKTNPEIQAIMATGNQSDALSEQLASIDYNFSSEIKNSFQQRYRDYLKNPANPNYHDSFQNIITNIKGYMSGIFQLNNEVQQASENLNQMVAFMDRDMKKLKNQNASLETDLIANENEKRSTQQLVSDNQVVYKVEKYKFFFYLVGLLYIIYFTLFRIFKLNLGTITTLGSATASAAKALGKTATDGIIENVEKADEKEKPVAKEETENKSSRESSSSSSSSSS